jgi:hypothetical protein
VATVTIFDDITNKVLDARHLAGFWLPGGLWLAVTAVAGIAMFTGDYLTSLASEGVLLRLRRSAVWCRVGRARSAVWCRVGRARSAVWCRARRARPVPR